MEKNKIERLFQIEDAISALEIELERIWRTQPSPEDTKVLMEYTMDLQGDLNALQKEYKRLSGRYYSSG